MAMKSWLLVLLCLPLAGRAQLAVEVYGGTRNTTLDILYFQFFKDKAGQPSKFLFFNRNRASIDYRQTSTAYLPQFGFTEAISYNHPRLKGFAPVLVAQVFGSGVYPKAGMQYVHSSASVTVFSWLVSETLRSPALDYFLLLRLTPRLNDNLNLFFQAESVNTWGTERGSRFSFTQRGRLGLKRREWQFGIGVDLNQTGRVEYSHFSNTGLFVKHEF
jgi:hypothetical protein